MIEAFLASQGGAAFFGGLGQGLGRGGAGGATPSALISGAGGLDGRASLDGAGWTVATGRAAAYGANLPARPNVLDGGATAAPWQPMQAGMSPLLMVALALVAAGLIFRSRKG